MQFFPPVVTTEEEIAVTVAEIVGIEGTVETVAAGVRAVTETEDIDLYNLF